MYDFEPIAYLPADAGLLLCPCCAEDYASEHGLDLDNPDAFGAMFAGSEAEGRRSTCCECGEEIEGETVLCFGFVAQAPAKASIWSDDAGRWIAHGVACQCEECDVSANRVADAFEEWRAELDGSPSQHARAVRAIARLRFNCERRRDPKTGRFLKIAPAPH